MRHLIIPMVISIIIQIIGKSQCDQVLTDGDRVILIQADEFDMKVVIGDAHEMSSKELPFCMIVENIAAIQEVSVFITKLISIKTHTASVDHPLG